MTAELALRFDLVMFDLDGTLVETAGEIHTALNRTLQRFGLGAATLEQVESWIGHGTRALLVKALAQFTATAPEAVTGSCGFDLAQAEFARHYADCCGTQARPYPGARQALQGLRAAGVRLAVVTNKERAHARRVLDSHGLVPLVDCIVTPEMAGAAKPDPAGLLHCLEAFGVAPGRALFVGDSAIDVEAARRAGVAVWAVPHGYNGGQPIAASSPDRVLAHLNELTEEIHA